MVVYAVWFDVLAGDDRSAWDPRLLSDERVVHYWDPERLLGTWLPQQPEYEDHVFGPLAWDIFFLYGPDALWDETPGPLVSSGSTVISKSGRLEEDWIALMEGN